MTDKTKSDFFAKNLATSVLDRLVACNESQRDQINDSDLDNEQPIAITFYGTLGDIRNARNASAMLKASIPKLQIDLAISNYCQGCGCTDFSPNLEIFEEDGSICCDQCAEDILEANSQFGVGA